MIIGLISQNPEISLSSRKNPEMSQRISIDNNANQISETFNKSQLSEFFDVSAGCLGSSVLSLLEVTFFAEFYFVLIQLWHQCQNDLF